MTYYSCSPLMVFSSVDPEGFEPSTFSMPLRRAPRLRYGPINGPGGIRTRDLFSAIEARSQLRYRPAMWAALYLHCNALSSNRPCVILAAIE